MSILIQFYIVCTILGNLPTRYPFGQPACADFHSEGTSTNNVLLVAYLTLHRDIISELVFCFNTILKFYTIPTIFHFPFCVSQHLAWYSLWMSRTRFIFKAIIFARKTYRNFYHFFQTSTYRFTSIELHLYLPYLHSLASQRLLLLFLFHLLTPNYTWRLHLYIRDVW